MTGFRKKLFAHLGKNGENTNERLCSLFKQELLKDFQVGVVEIGPVTGNNLRWLNSQLISWTGIEPYIFSSPYTKKRRISWYKF